MPTSLLDTARLVGGGGVSSGATGSGGQFTGLPTPGMFFISFSFLISALYLLPPLPLSTSIYICLLVVPCPAQESFTFTTSLLRISFPLADGMMRSRGQDILSTPHSAPYFLLRLDGLYSHLSFLPFFVRLFSFIKMVPDPTLAFAVLLS